MTTIELKVMEGDDETFSASYELEEDDRVWRTEHTEEHDTLVWTLHVVDVTETED